MPSNRSTSACLDDTKGVRTEVEEHALHQMPHLPDFVLDGFVGPIRSDESATPLLLDDVVKLSSVCVLADRETRSNLPTVPMSPARLERDAEAAFAVHEPRDVPGQIHRESARAGVLCALANASRGSQASESLRGSSRTILPSVLPAVHLQKRTGRAP